MTGRVDSVITRGTVRSGYVILLAMVFYGIGCARNAVVASEPSSASATASTPAAEGFILRSGGGERLQNGVVVKASPAGGTENSILVEQTFPKGRRTSLHLHEQGDELFYVVSGRGTARLGGRTDSIGPGDVIFVPRNTPHGIGNLQNEEPLVVVFFMSSPELVDEFRAIHQRVISDPDRPITPEERAAISKRVGGGKLVEVW
jgi:quercetin dioxygenase-like cupin family protein